MEWGKSRGWNCFSFFKNSCTITISWPCPYSLQPTNLFLLFSLVHMNPVVFPMSEGVLKTEGIWKQRDKKIPMDRYGHFLFLSSKNVAKHFVSLWLNYAEQSKNVPAEDYLPTIPSFSDRQLSIGLYTTQESPDCQNHLTLQQRMLIIVNLLLC